MSTHNHAQTEQRDSPRPSDEAHATERAAASLEPVQGNAPLGHSFHTRNDRDQRRIEVAKMLAAHIPERQMAARLGVSQSTISRDAAVVRKWWRQRAARDYDTLVAEESAKLDELERAFFGPALEGNVESAGILLKVLDRRARLLGLDRPARSESTVTVVEDAEAIRKRARALVLEQLERMRAIRAEAEAEAIEDAEIVE